MKVETLYQPNDETLSERLTDGWKIEAAFSEPTRILTDRGHYGGENHVECQMVVIISKP